MNALPPLSYLGKVETQVSYAAADVKCMDGLPSAIVRTLLYFDIFNHPLTRPELQKSCQHVSCTSHDAGNAIDELLRKNYIHEKDGYLFVSGKLSIVGERKERSERAASFYGKAQRYSKLISRFPFVRGVSISGSLSKGTMAKDGDIDYFIIAEPGRLWVCRSLLILFKKTILLNSRKYFCVNYFIDTKSLGIPDRNLFVATEISFIRPAFNKSLFDDFMKTNEWVKTFYPNFSLQNEFAAPKSTNGALKRFLEKSLSGNFGEWLDEKFFHITLRRWKKKFPHISSEQFDLNFRSRKNTSKHHPQGFQWKVQRELNERIAAFEQKHNLQLSFSPWSLDELQSN